jgi:hypothetical protein
MHVFAYFWRVLPVFVPSTQPNRPSVAHFPFTGKFGAKATFHHQHIENVWLFGAVAARPNDGYTVPLVET